VRLRDVVKRYPGVEALRGVSLEIARDELVAVVGPSGSGKSTLLQIMGTLDRPTSGEVRVAGCDVATADDADAGDPARPPAGVRLPAVLLLEGMTAVDNVALGLLYSGRPAAARRAAAAEALERVGLGERLGHRPNQLSGGERQRVAIARAVVARPELVLADEPTGNLDSRTGRSIVELLHELRATGTTIVVITHDRELAAAFPRQIRVRDGRLEELEGRPA
jgi:putative ABC transport system ATP-binding protein